MFVYDSKANRATDITLQTGTLHTSCFHCTSLRSQQQRTASTRDLNLRCLDYPVREACTRHMGYTTEELGFIPKQGQGTDFFSTASGRTQHPVQDVEGFGVWVTQYIYVFLIVLRIKDDYTLQRHNARDLCDREAVCFCCEFVEQDSNL